MKNKISALGQYLVKETGKNFNFKMIKPDGYYKGVLFSYGIDDYLVSSDRVELLGTIELISMKTARDYPAKLVRRYTHSKFDRIGKKKEETIVVNGVKYYIIKL
ncbi:hypothetical protein [Cetobacterium sp.]|uniref:hypothetical protein n=1 Tax=Cetobacterium sp. TaxID=2071632 RepID=UPI0025DD583E|nr:hypothetical protein [uncultured Cetobacterium sp.]